MPDMGIIQGAITSLNTAANIAKGFLQLHTMAEVQGKVIELQSAILAAQSSALAAQSDQFAMVDQIRTLKEEIAQVKAWKEQKQRYQLISPWNGFFVYALKEQSKGTEPAHWICAKCYEDGSKCILQDVLYYDKRMIHAIKCFNCKAEIERREATVPAYA